MKLTDEEIIEALNTSIIDKEIIENTKNDYIYIDNKGAEKISIPKLATEILNQETFKTLIGKEKEEIWHYADGVWQNNGKEIILKITEKLILQHTSNHLINEIIGKIKRQTITNKELFNNAPTGFICLLNGVLDLNTKKLSRFSPEYNLKTKINIKYDPTKSCPLILKFLDETLYPEDLPIIQEWLGFQLYNKYFIKKALILFGPKNTGKTVLLNLLSAFIGSNNKSGISLHRISSNDKFALSSLHNKYSNVYDDLSSDDLSTSGGFKIATGGGFITAEYKFGESFEFLNFAKHTFACNNIPSVKDMNDDAYYSRWIPLALDNVVDESDIDNFLIDKLITASELSGLLNWCLIGLQRLLINGCFSFDKSSGEVKSIMESHSNAMAKFAYEVLVRVDGARLEKDVMFGVYSLFCVKNGLQRFSKSQFSRNLLRYCNFVVEGHDVKRFWRNVGVGDNFKVFLDRVQEELKL